MCADKQKCVYNYDVCDAKYDCDDNSDEDNCQPVKVLTVYSDTLWQKCVATT